jgi:FkbM family methyltransferase
LNRERKVEALCRFVAWQIGSRLVPGPVLVPFVNGANLIVRPGMAGATGNIYAGLSDFEEMAFVLHLLRPGDVFVDVGANIGAYTVLAASAGARCVTFEPVPDTFKSLQANVRINAISDRCQLYNVAVGGWEGRLGFTTAHDCMNHAAVVGEQGEVTEVPVLTLDQVLADANPVLMKIDVEGFESEVLKGADVTLRKPSLLGLIMELNGSGRRYGYSDCQLHATVLSYGFVCYRYAPLTRDFTAMSSLSSGSNNNLYIRDLAAVQSRVATAHACTVRGMTI